MYIDGEPHMEEPFASMMMVWVSQRSLGYYGEVLLLIVVLETLFGFRGAHALVLIT